MCGAGSQQGGTLVGRQRQAAAVVDGRQLCPHCRLPTLFQPLGGAEARIRVSALRARFLSTLVSPSVHPPGPAPGSTSLPSPVPRRGGPHARGRGPAAATARTARTALPLPALAFSRPQELVSTCPPQGVRSGWGDGPCLPSSTWTPAQLRAVVICSTAPGTVRVCFRRERTVRVRSGSGAWGGGAWGRGGAPGPCPRCGGPWRPPGRGCARRGS